MVRVVTVAHANDGDADRPVAGTLQRLRRASRRVARGRQRGGGNAWPTRRRCVQPQRTHLHQCRRPVGRTTALRSRRRPCPSSRSRSRSRPWWRASCEAASPAASAQRACMRQRGTGSAPTGARRRPGIRTGQAGKRGRKSRGTTDDLPQAPETAGSGRGPRSGRRACGATRDRRPVSPCTVRRSTGPVRPGATLPPRSGCTGCGAATAPAGSCSAFTSGRGCVSRPVQSARRTQQHQADACGARASSAAASSLSVAAPRRFARSDRLRST